VSAAPWFIGGSPVVAYARLDGRQRPTGNTRHLANGTLLGPAAGLAICRLADGGFYLFGCDAGWNPITDTWHETLDDALHQAEFEYEGVGSTWEWPEGKPDGE
jgi:hypothetical protein